MMIKYYYQSGYYIDKSNAMTIKFDKVQDLLDKPSLIDILERDEVNIKEIEAIRYYDKQCDGWLLFNDHLVLNFTGKDNEILELIIKKLDQVDMMEIGLIEHLQEINQRILFQDSRIREIENLVRISRFCLGDGIAYGESNRLAREKSLNNNYSHELRKMTSPTTLFNSKSFRYNELESRLDISFLYSNPLVKIVKDTIITLNEPIDFEKEINNLVDTFKNSNKKISARFEIANVDNFQEIIRKNPKILHISCHGAYEEVDNQSIFYLYFEDDKGGLVKFDIKMLKDLLTDELQKIEIVFVSACHSEPVADVFRSLGVPVVIAVHSDTMVLDLAAQKFSKVFYESLLDGKSVRYSYETSRTAVFTEFDFRNSKIMHCCCFHKHKPECPWKERAYKDSEDAHLMHVKTCKCLYSESHEHSSSCVWVEKFREKLDIQIKHVIKINSIKNNIKVCCCSPEIAHDESNKFIMKTDPMFDHKTIFENVPQGILDIKNKSFCLNIKFSVDMKTSLIGRNRELYEVINIYKNSNNIKDGNISVRKNRLVTVCGIEGIGKKSFAKLAGIYLYERKNFDAGVYFIELKNSNASELDLISNICMTLEINIQISSILQLLKLIDTKMLLIFKITKTNKECLEDYKNVMDNIIRTTKLIKLIVVSSKPLNSEFENVVSLKTLDPYYSAKLLLTLAGEFLPVSLKNINSLIKHELVSISKGIPSKIKQIAAFLQEGIKLENLFDRMKKENLIKHSLSDELVHVLISNLIAGDKNKKNKIYELLYLLTISPNGIIERDLIEMHENKSELSSQIYLLNEFMEKDNNLIYIKEVKDLSKKVYCIANDFVSSVANLSLSFEKELKKKVVRNLIFFYARLFRSLVVNLCQVESFTEFSAVQNYGMWLSIRNKDKYKEETLFNPVKHYQHTEGNLNNLIKIEKLKSLFSNSNDSLGDSKDDIEAIVLESLEQLSICVPTVLKLIGRQDDCMIMIRIFTEILENFNLSVAKGRLMLFSMSVYPAFSQVGSFGSLNLNFNNNSEQLNYHTNQSHVTHIAHLTHLTIYPQILSIFTSASYKEGLAETHFCKAVIKYEIESIKCRKNNNIFNFKLSKETFSEIEMELEESLKIYREIIEEDNIVNIGYARVCFILSEYTMKNKPYDDLSLERLHTATKIFDEQKKKYYYIKSLLGISKWYFGVKRLAESKGFAELALQTATKIKNKILEGEVKDIISDIYDAIRVESHNVFVFLKAHQLVYCNSILKMNKNSSGYAEYENRLNYIYSGKDVEEAVEPIILNPSDFRVNLIKTIKSIDREIFIKFEVLTKPSFADVIKKGGRILHLSSDFYTAGNSLYVEGEYGETVEITNMEIEAQLRNTKCLYDLVIISIPQSLDLAETFIQAGVPHVICFDFDELALEFIYKSINFPLEKIKNDFTYCILSNIIHEKTIEEAFKYARREFLLLVESLKDQFNIREDLPSGDIVCVLGNGPMLLPRNTNHEVKFYGKLTKEETMLHEGKIMDLSKLRARIANIEKREIKVIGRKKEIYFSVKNFMYNYNLNIYGDVGVGKTTLVKEIGYFLSVRQKFKDGIFYLNVDNITSVENLKDLFEENQISIAIEENKKTKHSSSEDRRILIILDNCDKIIKHSDNQFFLFVFSLNKDNNNSVLFLLTSHRKIVNQNFLHSDYLHLTTLNRRESAYLFLSLCKRNLDRREIDVDIDASNYNISLNIEDKELFDLIFNSKRVRSCRGYPNFIKRLAELTLNQSLDRVAYERFLPAKLWRRMLEKEGFTDARNGKFGFGYGFNAGFMKEMKRNKNNSYIQNIKNVGNVNSQDNNSLLLMIKKRNMSKTNPHREQESNSENDVPDYKMDRTINYLKKSKILNKKKKFMTRNINADVNVQKLEIEYEEEEGEDNVKSEDTEEENINNFNIDKINELIVSSHSVDSQTNSDSDSNSNSVSNSNSSSESDSHSDKQKQNHIKRNNFRDSIDYKLANSLVNKQRRKSKKDFKLPAINKSSEKKFKSFNNKSSTGNFEKTLSNSLNILNQTKGLYVDKLIGLSKQECKKYFDNLQKKTEMVLNQVFNSDKRDNLNYNNIDNNTSNNNNNLQTEKEKVSVNKNTEIKPNKLNNNSNIIYSNKNVYELLTNNNINNKNNCVKKENFINKFSLFNENDNESSDEKEEDKEELGKINKSKSNINLLNLENLSILNNFILTNLPNLKTKSSLKTSTNNNNNNIQITTRKRVNKKLRSLKNKYCKLSRKGQREYKLENNNTEN